MAVCFRYARYRLPRFLPPARLSKPALPPQPAAGLTASHWTLFPVEVVFSQFPPDLRAASLRSVFRSSFRARFALSFGSPSRTFLVFAGIAVFGEFRDRASSAVDVVELADRLPGVRSSTVTNE